MFADQSQPSATLLMFQHNLTNRLDLVDQADLEYQLGQQDQFRPGDLADLADLADQVVRVAQCYLVAQLAAQSKWDHPASAWAD
jgi:hypothetical protein